MRDQDLVKAFDQIRLKSSCKAKLFESSWRCGEQKPEGIRKQDEMQVFSQQEIVPASREWRFTPAISAVLCVVVIAAVLTVGPSLPLLRGDKSRGFSAESQANTVGSADGSVLTSEGEGGTAEEEAILTPEGKGSGSIKQLDGFSMETTATEGFYQVKTKVDESGKKALYSNITYTDFTTNTQSYLCQDPDCSHDSVGCQSYFSLDKDLEPHILYVNGNILALVRTWDDAVSGYGEIRIEIMDGNGGNRRLLANLDPEINFTLGPYSADDSFLYFMSEQYLSNAQEPDAYKTGLYRLDLQTGECSRIKSFENVHLTSGYDDYLYFIQWGRAPEDNTAALNANKSRTETTKTSVITKMNPNNGEELQVVEEYDGLVWKGRMLDSVFYYYDTQNDTFNSHNYVTGEKTSIANTTGYKMEGAFDIDSIIDGKLVFSSTVDHDITEETEELVITNFAWDLEEGRIYEIKQMLMQNGAERPISIIGNFNGRIYAIYEWGEIAYPDAAGYYGMLGHISQEEFFSGAKNYVPIEMLDAKP